MKACILEQKHYPGAAERLGHYGSVKVEFSLDAEGGLQAVRVGSTSGWDELDSASLDAVRRAAPFPAFPSELGRDRLSLAITLRYQLH